MTKAGGGAPGRAPLNTFGDPCAEAGSKSLTSAGSAVPDKNTQIVVCCNSGGYNNIEPDKK